MKISRIQIATIFKLDRRILLTCGEGLKKIEKEINGNLQILSMADVLPPEAPRAMIKSVDTLVNLGLNRLDVIITPPPHLLSDTKSSLNYAYVRTAKILSILKENLGYEWSGCVVICQYPKSKTGTGLKSITPVFDALMKINRNDRELSAFHLTFGFVEEPISRNFVISGYETKKIALSNLVGRQQLTIDLTEIPSQEVGIQVVIDLNNKLNKKMGLSQDIEQLVSRMGEELDNLPNTLVLKEILA